MHKTRTCLLTALATLGLLFPAIAADDVLSDGDFEGQTIGKSPVGWTSFTTGTTPNATIVSPGADGSGRCVEMRRSDHGGWVALTKDLQRPQSRVMIEFSFAFSAGSGRSLNLWTHEPGGRDASQFNLCIENGRLKQFDGRTRSWETISNQITPSGDRSNPVWSRLRAVVDAKSPGIDFWLSRPGSLTLPEEPTATRHAYRTNLPIGAIDLVSGTRLADGAWFLIDDLVVRGGDDLPAPSEIEPLPEPFVLWTGGKIPAPGQSPFVPGMEHFTIQHATEDGYKFLHGAAIVSYKGALYANWANSPVNENGPQETLQGRRSHDGGRTWSELEVIGPGFEGPDRHSHGVLFVHDDKLWTIGSRFGVGVAGRRFPGLGAEAFVLNEDTDRWESRGVVMQNCWPYDEPIRMTNGSRITGGQDKDGLPVVAVSHGDDLAQWDTIAIPFPPRLAPSFAETTVLPDGPHALAVIRGGGGVAWVSNSRDFGRTWSMAQESNLPMPRAKAYLGLLSTGQRYLLSNLGNRDTLVISVSEPGENTLSRMWTIRHGPSVPPRFPGAAKGKQWSYPYGHEQDGRLYVVYSIGKEDCGLSVIPIESLVK